MLIFIVVDILGGYIVYNFYYTSVKQQLASQAGILYNSMQYYANDKNTNFSAQIKSIVENYSEKGIIELQAIDDDGEVVVSSSGFSPTDETNMPDYYETLKTDDVAYFTGDFSTGEKIMAASMPIPASNSGYSALRLLVSMQRIDRQVSFIIIALVIISLGILALSFSLGLLFIKSIVVPVRQIGTVARKFAAGDFSARVENKYTNKDEIGELCDVVNYMADELANADQMKNDFISSVSHELRTPLTAIKGWAETLNAVDDVQTIRKGMRVISAESDRLSGMVEELLYFSRIQNGKFTMVLSNMDVLAELEDAVLIYQEGAKRAGIIMHYNAPENLPILYGDKNRIRQVFINILDNAIKYSNEGSEVWIDAEDLGERVKITIKDTGCGISEADLPKVKTKFYKANHTRRGSGIGLAVAEEIINMHDGIINLTSEENIGTTVEIILPVKPKKAEQLEIVNLDKKEEVEERNEQ